MTAVVDVEVANLVSEYPLEVGCEVELKTHHLSRVGIYLGEVKDARLVFDPTVGVVPVYLVQSVIVRRPAPSDADELLLLRALAAEAVNHRLLDQAHSARIEEITRVAHDEADARDWCEDFDRILGKLGLAQRQHEYEISVTFSGSVMVSVTGSNEDDALEAIDSSMVRDALRQEGWDNLRVDVDDTRID